METSLFLAQLLGVYFVLIGIIVAVRQKSVMPAVSDLSNSRALLLLIAVVEIAAGLAILLTQSSLTFDYRGIITVVGYMLVVEGVLYLVLPHKLTKRFIKGFNHPHWYVVGGVAAVGAGAYLAGVGFGYL